MTSKRKRLPAALPRQDMAAARKTSFTALPLELRRLIYEHVLPYKSDISTWLATTGHYRHPRQSKLSTALFYVNKATSAEARQTYYESNTFVCDDAQCWRPLKDFLENIGPSNRALLKNVVLRFSDESRAPFQELTEDGSHYRSFAFDDDGDDYQTIYLPVPQEFRQSLQTWKGRYDELTPTLDNLLHRRKKERTHAEFIDADMMDCITLLKEAEAATLNLVCLEWDLPLVNAPIKDCIYSVELEEPTWYNAQRYVVSTTLPDILATACKEGSLNAQGEARLQVHWTFQMPPDWLCENRAAIDAGWSISAVEEIESLAHRNEDRLEHAGWSLIAVKRIVKEGEVA